MILHRGDLEDLYVAAGVEGGQDIPTDLHILAIDVLAVIVDNVYPGTMSQESFYVSLAHLRGHLI